MNLNKKTKKLRTGYTTGACAAAAAKGALYCLLGNMEKHIAVNLPSGEKAKFIPDRVGVKWQTGFCEVIKDAGDDPDVTNGAVVRADLKLTDSRAVVLTGGDGVGIVTRPGLAVFPGESAINPVPRKMICSAVEDILPANKGAEIIISVKDGERLAEKTLNSRLGIIGGISILGTTGIVFPYSHQAYRESIVCAMHIARASGLDTVVFSTGRRSEKIAQTLFHGLAESAFVMMADHFSFAIAEALKHAMERVVISCFPGKLLKIAAGAGCTHYSSSSTDFQFLADIAEKEGASKRVLKEIVNANTVRHAFALIPGNHINNICACLSNLVRERINSETNSAIKADVLILSYDSKILYHQK